MPNAETLFDPLLTAKIKRPGLVVHVTTMFVTFALPIVPVPLVTTHVWAGVVGCVCTVTAYAVPGANFPATSVGYVPLAAGPICMLSETPLFCSVSLEPTSPLTVPPRLHISEPQEMTHPEPEPQAVSAQKGSKEASRQVSAFMRDLTDKLPGLAGGLPAPKELLDSSIR
jgi:hypothetical protein